MKGIFILFSRSFAFLSILLGLISSRAEAQYNYSLAIPAQYEHIKYDLSLLSYNDFYQNLAPYGQWIEDAEYGYVWSPEVDGNFRPYYTNGHWAMTDYGNTWISDYPWGWACFHYGRWTYSSYYGWLWAPGQHWGPAWVDWRNGNGFYGWAPLSPGYSLKSKTEYACPGDWWVFIPPQYLYSGNYYRYRNGTKNNKDILRNSATVDHAYENDNIIFVYGPQALQIQPATHQPVTVFKLSNSNNLYTKLHGIEIKMYRPAEIRPVAKNSGEKAIPPNVVRAPRPVGKPESINGGEYSTPLFRANLPKSTPSDAVGSHSPEGIKPAPQQNDNSPTKWDAK